MRRRHFLRQSSAAVAGVALAPAARAARPADVPAVLGIQLYSLRDRLPGDVNGVLESLARMGYGEVELAGTHERTPQVFADALAAMGLAAPSAHVGIDALRADLDGVLRAAEAMRQRYVVVPWLAPDERASRDAYLALADELNAVGEQTRAAGVTLGYHNHAFEFETLGGDAPVYDAFVARLDPDLVVLELDLYWITNAGYDPVDYFQRFPGRFPLWHVKDGRGPDLDMVPVGDGRIDFARLFAASETAGLRHAFVEHDQPADSLAMARSSLAHLRSLD